MGKVGVQQITDRKQRIAQLIQQGRCKDARKLCEKLCIKNKDDAESHYMLGSIYGQMGNYREASIRFRQAAELQPTAFVAYDSLGTALNALGDLEAAVKAFRDALGLQPDNADTLIKLAYTLAKMGNVDESEACLQRVLTLTPSSAEALDAVGDIRYQKGQYHEAIDCYERAISSDPGRVDSHTYMGNSLLRLGQSGKAVVCFEKVISLDPGNLDACIHMGHALKSVGDSKGARESYENALEIEPDNLIATAGIVDLCEREGDFEGAFKLLLPQVRRDKASADLAAAFVRLCHRFDCCDEAIDYALNSLENETMAVPDRANLEYALGRRFDQLGNFELAFSHYQRANALNQHAFDPIVHAGFVDALIKGFSPQFFAHAPRATVRSSRPVFIIGMPRSGTSLVEQVLASHPQVHGAGELNDIGDAVQSINKLSGHKIQYPYNLAGLGSELLDNIANRYLDHLKELDSEAIRVTDKHPVNFLHLGLIALAFPDAQVIHCTRDPRDTCLSIYFQAFSQANSYASNLEHIGSYYRQYEKLMRYIRGLNNIPIIDVAYEELVTNQEEVSRKLIDFIGLDWHEKCLAFHQTSRYVATPSYDQVREKMYTSSVGRWKNYEKYLGPLFEALEHE